MKLWGHARRVLATVMVLVGGYGLLLQLGAPDVLMSDVIRPTTALCAILLGCALLVLPDERGLDSLRDEFAQYLGTAVILMMLGVLLGLDFTDISGTAATASALAVATGVVLVAVGVWLVRTSLKRQRRALGARVGIYGGIAVAIASMLIGLALSRYEQSQLDAQFERIVDTVERLWADHVRRDRQALLRMAARFTEATPASIAMWQRDADRYIADLPYLEHLSLVTAEGEPRAWASRQDAMPAPFRAALARRPDRNVHALELAGERSLLVLDLPVAAQHRIVAAFDWLGELLRLCEASGEIRLLEVQVDGAVIFQAAAHERSPHTAIATRTTSIDDALISVHFHDARPLIRSASGRLPLQLYLIAVCLVMLGVWALILFLDAQERREGIVVQTERLRRQIARRRAIQRELLERTRELEETNAALREFAYVASHDLREPLRGIDNSLRFLSEDEPGIGEAGQKRISTTRALVSRLSSQLQALLHYSRLGAEAPVLKSHHLDDIVDAATASISALLADRNVQLLRPRPLPQMSCDRRRVITLYRTLIENAVIYNDGEPPVVELDFREADPPVLIVRDNGLGVPEAAREKIMRLFTRLHHRDEYGGGIGAGLAVASKIVAEAGGRIWVEPGEGGAGSVFCFTLAPGNGQPED